MTYYVYLIQKGYGSIKIGVSKDPEKRLRHLQIGNHAELFIIAKFPFGSYHEAYALESDLHYKFKNFRLKGEWFKKGILRNFDHRAKLFPNVFRPILKKGECFNSYHNQNKSKTSPKH